jgi:hypothetical protein
LLRKYFSSSWTEGFIDVDGGGKFFSVGTAGKNRLRGVRGGLDSKWTSRSGGFICGVAIGRHEVEEGAATFGVVTGVQLCMTGFVVGVKAHDEGRLGCVRSDWDARKPGYETIDGVEARDWTAESAVEVVSVGDAANEGVMGSGKHGEAAEGGEFRSQVGVRGGEIGVGIRCGDGDTAFESCAFKGLIGGWKLVPRVERAQRAADAAALCASVGNASGRAFGDNPAIVGPGAQTVGDAGCWGTIPGAG